MEHGRTPENVEQETAKNAEAQDRRFTPEQLEAMREKTWKAAQRLFEAVRQLGMPYNATEEEQRERLFEGWWKLKPLGRPPLWVRFGDKEKELTLVEAREIIPIEPEPEPHHRFAQPVGDETAVSIRNGGSAWLTRNFLYYAEQKLEKEHSEEAHLTGNPNDVKNPHAVWIAVEDMAEGVFERAMQDTSIAREPGLRQVIEAREWKHRRGK
jgi:hypothetical protein